jgi:hypothetical protein
MENKTTWGEFIGHGDTEMGRVGAWVKSGITWFLAKTQSRKGKGNGLYQTRK